MMFCGYLTALWKSLGVVCLLPAPVVYRSVLSSCSSSSNLVVIVVIIVIVATTASVRINVSL